MVSAADMLLAEMVLFYCTFVALKARNTLTVQVHPGEYKLQREKRLFQAYVCIYIYTWIFGAVLALARLTDGHSHQANHR